MACYGHAKKLVEQDKTTWDDLVALGLALAVSDGGDDPFTASFNEKTKRSFLPCCVCR
jgi:hypothetical protein